MTTETLVTIDDTTLTTITGGRQSDATMNPPGCYPFWGQGGCPPKHSGTKPAPPSAPATPYQRPGFPYATESRL